MRKIFVFVRRLVLFLLFVFVLPALIHLAIWQADASRPESWNRANWSSSDLLPSADEDREAVVYVMAARTGRWKGGFAVHSWIVTKKQNGSSYNRYDVVGWGNPVRHNAYAPDARWYSNQPEIVKSIRGKKATELIPKIENAVRTYPFADRGTYQAWPGPNSNSFVAHVLNEVPEIGIVPPAAAVGRDYLSNGRLFRIDPDWLDLQVNLGGYAGFAMGRRSGFELHFLGLVAGIDILNPAIKIPGFGRIGAS